MDIHNRKNGFVVGTSHDGHSIYDVASCRASKSLNNHNASMESLPNFKNSSREYNSKRPSRHAWYLELLTPDTGMSQIKEAMFKAALWLNLKDTRNTAGYDRPP